MTDLAKLVVKLEAQSGKLTKELEKANRRAASWEKKTKKSVNSVKSAFAALGVGIAAIKFKNFVQDQIAAADAIGKTADKLGVSTKSLQAYRFAASQSGVENSVMEKGLQNMVRNLADFGKGIGEAKAELEAMGFTQQQLMAMSPDQQFAAIADKLRLIENNTQRVNTAYKIFGGRATALLNITRDGSAGLKAYSDQAEAAGLIIEDSMIRNAEEANNRMDVLGKTLSTKLTIAVVDNAKGIEDLTESLITFIHYASEAPKFIRFLSDELNNMFNRPQTQYDISNRLEFLKKQIFNTELSLFKLRQQGGAEGVLNALFFGESGTADVEKRLQMLRKEQEVLLAKQKELQMKTPTLNKPGAVGGVGDQTQSPEVVAKQERDDVILQMEYDLQDKLLAVRAQKAEQYAQIQKDVESKVKMFRENSMNHAVNLLSVLGQKSKVFAAAAIILEKATAIQRVLIQSKVAAMAALTPPPIGLGPVAGAPLAASIEASGQASALFIGATGVAQLADLGGNSSGSTSVGSTTTETSNNLDQQLQRQDSFSRDITINVTGGIADRDTAEAIADSLREYLGDGGRAFA